MATKISVIGAGFSGLSAASSLASKGYEVHVYEKHDIPGGRARKYSEDGFTYDMGPSWYWMPDVFEKFFNQFGKSTSDYYKLDRLDPSYRVFYGANDYVDVPTGKEKVIELFESIEKGSGDKLRKLLKEAAFKYEVGVNDLVYRPSLSFTEFLEWRIVKSSLNLHMLRSVEKYVRANFKNERLHPILYFPVIFIGATPRRTPALYTLMNYADMELGTWYPRGGMYEVVDAMEKLAKSLGVQFHYNADVQEIKVNHHKTEGIIVNDELIPSDAIVASADYHFVEQNLLPESHRTYSQKYWNSREMAPSSLLFYLGIDKKLDHFEHHTMLFDEDFYKHANDLFDQPRWPEKPLLYTSCTSKTDNSVAPEGKENLMVLIPVAPGLKDTEETREKYYNLIMDRLEENTGQHIREHVIYKRSYAHQDFARDYNAFKGNAYGLGNTLRQTAFLKPRILNKKLKNLFYTGQLTTPGPGVPPAIISGQVVANVIENHSK